MSSNREKIFEKNLDLLKQKDSLTELRIELTPFHEIQIGKTDKNEDNIFKKRFGTTQYFHSQEGAQEEAEQIVKECVSKKTDVIFFYGIGLGYVYDALQDWLNHSTEHHIIFLEDDLEVIYHFLHTERATRFLKDPRVFLIYFADADKDLDKLRQLHLRFPYFENQFLALPHYVETKYKEAYHFCFNILYDQSWINFLHTELFSGQFGFYKNYYSNLLYTPESYIASNLFGKFKNIPAIICGAGPSLEKNIDVLKTLTDKALIFSGGSALNVLNAYGLTPHFGLGIDPNPEQFHRLLSNDSFHIPFFYRNRMEHEAFKSIQGPKLYVPGSYSKSAKWFEEKLGIHSPLLDEGFNVVTFCIEIARSLGCNPIIFVGMDLAFTETKTYAPGILTHPLWLGESDPYTPEAQQVVFAKDIHGKKITTKWLWITESNFTCEYVQNHPELTFINATEGGLGYPTMQNMTLKEVENKFLTQSFDLKGKVHGEIQNSRLPGLTKHAIIQILNEYKKSLEKCLKCCESIVKEQAQYESVLISNPNSHSEYSPQSILQESLLHEEIGYQSSLKEIEDAKIFIESSINTGRTLTLEEKNVRLMARYLFLSKILSQHITLLNSAVYEFILSCVPTIVNSEIPFHIDFPNDRYEFKDNLLIIQDEELGLNLRSELAAEAKRDYYESGELKLESFYLPDGRLHGPSTFFAKNGVILSKGWFFEGKRNGKTWLYYDTGGLYGIERFKNNLKEGKQEYYFRNGNPASLFVYSEKGLEGEVNIYDSEKLLIRQLHYKNGKRHGSEKMWNHNHIRLMECHYENGIPIDSAMEWDKKMKPKKRVVIRKFPKDFDSKQWNSNGDVIREFIQGVEDFSDFYKSSQEKVDYLDSAIALIMNHLTPIVKAQQESLGDKFPPELRNEMEKIQNSIKSLQELKQQLIDMQNEHLKWTEDARKKHLSE